MSVFNFVSRQDAVQLDESLDAGDVSRAWLVWSGAAEVALADAFRFSGGPLGVWFLGGECFAPCCLAWLNAGLVHLMKLGLRTSRVEVKEYPIHVYLT